LKWLNEQRSCPICRTPCNRRGLGDDLIAFNAVNDLAVICLHKGCGWTGKLANAEGHDSECAFHPERLEPWIANKLPEKGFGEEEDLDGEEEGSLLSSLYLKYKDVLKQVLEKDEQEENRLDLFAEND
jgi:hypothetical protein